MPKKESGAQGRKRRAQFEVFLNESRKFMKKILKVVAMQKDNRPIYEDKTNLLVQIIKKIKSNLHYTRRITPKRVTSCGAHLRGLAPGLHSSEETSQRWRAVGDTVPI